MTTIISESGSAFIKNVCANHKNNRHELINILHEVQHEFGYLPKEAQQEIAKSLNIPLSKVYGVVSFYSFFTMEPKGKYLISICLGTACYVRNSELVLDEFCKQLGIKAGETTKDGLFSITSIRCVGACGLAPVVMINDKIYGRLKPQQVKKIIEEYRQKEKEPTTPVFE
jgi:NADH-quinone oxidoreductase subunit E/NADP-reducing hydrogenase subunit HndA